MERGKITTGSATATTGTLTIKPGFSRSPSEFQNFADLTRNLVQVPKEAVDKRRRDA